MRLLVLCLIMSAYAAVANADPSQPPYPITYEGCRDAGNGIYASGPHSNANAPGQDGRTRQGNNGKGNGGEAVDVFWYGYNPYPGNPATWVFTAIHYACYSTDSEDSEGGRWYINDKFVGPLPPGFALADELDPGML